MRKRCSLGRGIGSASIRLTSITTSSVCPATINSRRSRLDQAIVHCTSSFEPTLGGTNIEREAGLRKSAVS